MVKHGKRILTTAGSRYINATGWLGGLAVFLAAVGVLALLAKSQSPSFLMWTGHAVPGVKNGNSVNYKFDGVEYTFEVPGPGRSAQLPPLKVTVYLDPSEPLVAVVNNLATRIFDATFVLTPFMAAGFSALFGLLRVRRVRRRPPPTSTGNGFAPGELRSRREP